MKCLAAVLALAALVTDSLPAGACAPAPPKGAEVRIADEEAVIQWDPVLVGTTVVAIARARRFGTENNVAIGALGRGELAKAHEVFVRWAPSREPVISAMARHNLGWTLMLEGRLEEAGPQRRRERSARFLSGDGSVFPP